MCIRDSFDALHQHVHLASDARGDARAAHGVGQVAQALGTVVLLVLVQLAGQVERARSLLARVREHAHVVEQPLLDEGAQVLELLLGLAREARDERLSLIHI